MTCSHITHTLLTWFFRILQLRNPWGRFSWKGDWGPKSDMWKDVSPHTKQELHPADSDTGVFWIALDDFVK